MMNASNPVATSHPLDLTECRAQIDHIDQQLHALFLARMAVAEQVATYKQTHNLPLTHPDREQQLLLAYKALTPPHLQDHVQEFFHHLMEVSKSYQQQILSQDTPSETT